MNAALLKRAAVLIAALAACAGLSGCSYTTRTLFRPDIKTIYVQLFDNRTFRREVEVDLTKAVVEEIKLRTQLRFASKDEADSILTGTLLEFTERARVKDEDDTVIIERVTLRVSFRWRDRLTEADIVAPQEVVESARVTAGESLRALAVQEAAQRIVERMQDDW